VYYLCKLLTYVTKFASQVGVFHTIAPINGFTAGLTYFSRSQRSKCKNPILGQPGWHKS